MHLFFPPIASARLVALTLTVGLAFSPNLVAWQSSAGMLEAGDQAPNFNLRSLSGEHDTELASLNKVAVLFFGSYS